MIDGFHNIIDACVFRRDAKRICLEDISCLLFGQTIAFYVVRAVGEVNLCAVIDTTFKLALFLLAQAMEQWRYFLLGFLGQDSIGRDI